MSVTDEIDIAQELERRHVDAALRRFRQTQEQQVPAADCVDCEGEIDDARRAAVPKARRCVECERRREQQRRLSARR